MECARLATQDAGATGGPVYFGVYKGNECYAADEKSGTKYGISRSCNLRPDERGANVGGTKEFALYTLAPRGVVAKYLRLARRSIDPPRSGDLHVVGLVALTSGWQAVVPTGVRAMQGDKQTLIPRTSESGADQNTTQFLEKLQRVKAELGLATTFLHLGPGQAFLPMFERKMERWSVSEVGNTITLDLGRLVRVEAVSLRNRTMPGKTDIEDRLVGCILQLLNENNTVLWEKRIQYGASHYQFDV